MTQIQRSTQLLVLLRPHQWLKNLFLFIPIFFAGELTNLVKLKTTFFSFWAFCFTASAIYIINDLRDRESDRVHPTKHTRPLASGTISPTQAGIMLLVLLMAATAITYSLANIYFGIVIAVYFFLNLAYCYGLKNISIVDILIVASGFVFRVIAGGFVADVKVSQWMVMMIFLLALFLVLAKRRDDVLIYHSEKKITRKNIVNYNLEFINALLMMLSGVIIVSYLMYVISPEVIELFHSPHLYFTTVFVIAGVMRYLQITMVENKSGSPTEILYADNFIRLTVIGWSISFYLIIYLI
jgi:decaprenyl-phosphate phosphoribosyltransferase